MSESPDATRAPRRRFAWLRAASDRVPTKWFAGIATGAFLLATAAFGGLATAAPADLSTLDPGEPHVTDQRSLTVQRAVLIDALPEAGVSVEDGERVLALVVEVENGWDEPLSSTGPKGVAGSFRVAGVGAAEPAAARMDDTTSSPVLQPGVPAELVYAWAVDADAFADGQDVEVTLYDLSLYTGSFVTTGRWWDDPVADATVTVSVNDVGAGVDEDGGDGS
ncbi:hypothetical protein ACFC1I_19815 [Microbacterium sp. NPDC056044]|uniref:hypothetical protein n=1 Tax=Microbacterium sp. NPDC056044 TaxID=3345690 RepID=UPI0035DB64A6